MENTTKEHIDTLLEAQKHLFESGATRDIAFRKQQLRILKETLEDWQEPLAEALWTDLHKSYQEAYLTEISLVLSEIKTALSHIDRWSMREWKPSNMATLPGRSYIVKEPYGCALIAAPWNYPVLLLLDPLVGAITAGCTAILKPSPHVPNVCRVLQEMIEEAFSPTYIAVVQGHREVNQYLFSLKFDMIFYTGSPAVGRKVMAAAAENLVPVVLELGGKSPCIIDKTADLKVAAKRVAWGKTINSGQTCIAPDYILIHKDIKQAFIREFAEAIKKLHGDDIEQTPFYVRMVTEKAFDRVKSYMEEGKILYGGRSNREERFIEPTILGDVNPNSPVMTEEIFGPVFPMIEMDDSEGSSFKDKVADFVIKREKPLAFYYYGKEKDGWELVRMTSSGGGCINDCIMHIANSRMPFGGVGNSGMGHYHGKLSFEAFTHRRSIVCSPKHIDMPFRYMPYRLFNVMRHLI